MFIAFYGGYYFAQALIDSYYVNCYGWALNYSTCAPTLEAENIFRYLSFFNLLIPPILSHPPLPGDLTDLLFFSLPLLAFWRYRGGSSITKGLEVLTIVSTFFTLFEVGIFYLNNHYWNIFVISMQDGTVLSEFTNSDLFYVSLATLPCFLITRLYLALYHKDKDNDRNE